MRGDPGEAVPNRAAYATTLGGAGSASSIVFIAAFTSTSCMATSSPRTPTARSCGCWRSAGRRKTTSSGLVRRDAKSGSDRWDRRKRRVARCRSRDHDLGAGRGVQLVGTASRRLQVHSKLDWEELPARCRARIPRRPAAGQDQLRVQLYRPAIDVLGVDNWSPGILAGEAGGVAAIGRSAADEDQSTHGPVEHDRIVVDEVPGGHLTDAVLHVNGAAASPVRLRDVATVGSDPGGGDRTAGISWQCRQIQGPSL